MGLLKGRAGHEPPLTIVDSRLAEGVWGERAPTTLIGRLGPNGVANAGLRAICDCMKGRNENSFPTRPKIDA